MIHVFMIKRHRVFKMECSRVNHRLSYKNMALVLPCLIFLITFSSQLVFAAQTNESLGPQGYGWQQVYEVFNAATGSASRITGTADRKIYDYGFKQIQISGRKENYWVRDSGWWYVSSESKINITVWDAAGDVIYSGSGINTTKGRATATIPWGSDDDPGEWRARVDDGNLEATFKFYVRGKLMVDSFLLTPSRPKRGDNVVIEVIIKDNAGNILNRSVKANNGTPIPFNVTAFIFGPGDLQVINLTDDGSGYDANADDGIWTGNFTPSSIGDYKIKVKASDGHKYWVDGSRTLNIPVQGNFPLASVFLPVFSHISDKNNILALSMAAMLSSAFLMVLLLRKRGGDHE